MLVLLLVLLAAAAVCARLGVWQLDRAEIRGASEAAERRAEQAAAEPVGIGTVLAPQTTFRGELVGQHVTARGAYEPAGQLLVEGRALDGRTGYLVLTPLRVHDADPRAGADAGEGDGAGADGAGAAAADGAGVDGDAADVPGATRAGAGDPVLPVVRGWVADPDDAAALAVPEGEVTVSGYLQSSEGAGDGGTRPGRTDAISSAALVNAWGGPIWSGYVVLTRSEPDQGDALAQLPPPTRAGSGLNVQNLAYAAQWWIFGGFALVLWIRMVRDEARGDVPGMPGVTGGPPEPAPEPEVEVPGEHDGGTARAGLTGAADGGVPRG
ncbi:SURF1 family protein [Cellulomonas cellasea]|uniref:SURF1-like protein n=1 Tax=Cellulomonas cellasea TaxID=43670 RepID=A0A7W4UE96_9CELL|nr:SURF1 family protein [Cellulomonas cellasea]MBB2922603.1 cytochrome oxidase assembly protein ShyY1 [Cellulomonas cellasea]